LTKAKSVPDKPTIDLTRVNRLVSVAIGNEYEPTFVTPVIGVSRETAHNAQEQAKEQKVRKLTPKSTSLKREQVERWREIVSKYDWDVNIALAVMSAESGGNPDAISPTDDHGLMQIHKGLLSYGPKIYDPEFNIATAYRMYNARGWKPWSAYKSGSYKKYLN